MRIHIFLVALVVAILGAVIHPIAMLLERVGPADPQLISAIEAGKTVLADMFFWGLLAFFVTMAAMVFGDRIRRRISPVQDTLPSLEALPPSPKVAVALTAYNDAESIGGAAKDFLAQEDVVEVIVIDNNSVDGTAAVAAAVGARVVHEPEQGYGHACMRGLREAADCAQADVVVLAEGDGTFVGKDISKFLAYIGEADMLLGTRVVPGLVERGSQMDRFFTWGNIFASHLLRLRFWDSQFLGKARLSDVGCTYRMIRKDALARIWPDLTDGGYTFSLHMMVAALARKLVVVEIPVTFRRRIGESKGASRSIWAGLRIGMQMIWQMMFFRPRSRQVVVAATVPMSAK